MKKTFVISLLLFLVILMSACSLGGAKATATPEPPPATLVPVVIPTNTVAIPPTAEKAAPTREPTPTDEPTEEAAAPACEAFGHEDFDQPSPCWPSDKDSVFIENNVSNMRKVDVTVDDSQLQFEFLLPEEIYMYSFNTQYDYDEVILETSIQKIGDSSNQNGFALVCHVNKDGWYEARVSSGGKYEIFQYDTYKKQHEENPYVLIAGGATNQILIGSGRENIVRFECREDDLTLIINKKEVFYKQIKGMNSGGSIGLGLTSYSYKYPLHIAFDYIDIVQP